MSLLFFAVILSACAFDVTKIHPHFIDTKAGYSRVYEMKRVTPAKCGDPDYDPSYTGEHVPISEMNGYACLPVDEIELVRRSYNEYLRDQQNCPSNATSVAP